MRLITTTKKKIKQDTITQVLKKKQKKIETFLNV